MTVALAAVVVARPSPSRARTAASPPVINSRLLGTITIAHGAHQVTYAGHPLYRYDVDSPGSTDYVGARQYGGSWYALTSTGNAVK